MTKDRRLARIVFFQYGDVPDFSDDLVFSSICDKLGCHSRESRRLLWDCLWPLEANPFELDFSSYKPENNKLPLCSYQFYEKVGII